MSSLLALTEANFDSEIKKAATPILVDFWAPWCGPCRAQAPILDEVAKVVDAGVTVAKVNVDENQGLSGRYGIRGIPTLIVFKDGREVSRVSGTQSREELLAAVRAAR